MKSTLTICLLYIFVNVQSYSGTVSSMKKSTYINKVEDSLSLVADFSSDAVEVCPEEYIQFFDNSSGDIIEWEWSFEGGVPSTSTEQNPIVYYPDFGSFDVILVVCDDITSDTLYITDYIYIIETPDITFDELPEFCNNDPEYELIEGHPEGGEYSGTGVLFGHFVPAIAEVGTHTLSYYYLDENGCGDTSFQVAIVSAWTGFEDLYKDSRAIIYPNPAKDILHVKYKGEHLSRTKLEVYNSKGIIIFKTENEISKPQWITKFLISDWTPGIYLLLVYKNEKVEDIKKFIVQ